MYFSIFGDSISTYDGYNPSYFSVFYDQFTAYRNGLTDVNETWWKRVIDNYDGKLGINNSYSGSRVTGEYFPAANKMERLLYFKQGVVPDYVLVYIGFNDFGYGVKVKNNLFHFKEDPMNFKDAYMMFLRNLKQVLPETKIVCGTLMESYLYKRPEWEFPVIREDKPSFNDYNNVIREICKKEKVILADLASYNKRYETLDGTHPTVNGHKEIAEVWIEDLDSKKLIKR